MLIDQSDSFVFGFSKLDVMFGRAAADEVRHPYASIVKPGVRFVQTAIRSIDPAPRTVETDAGTFDGRRARRGAGRRPRPRSDARPRRGRARVLHASREDSRRARCSTGFEGGRVIIGVLSTPYKCPPAPSETALLLHEHLAARGLRERSEIALVIDFAGRSRRRRRPRTRWWRRSRSAGSSGTPRREVHELDPASKIATLRDGGEMPYDLFLAVPVHRAPAVVVESGMTRTAGSRSTRSRSRRPSPASTQSVTWRRSARLGRACSRRVRRRSPRSTSPRDPRDDGLGPIRRARDLLPGVRQQRGREGRRHLLRRQAIRGADRSLAGLRSRESRVRNAAGSSAGSAKAARACTRTPRARPEGCGCARRVRNVPL